MDRRLKIAISIIVAASLVATSVVFILLDQKKNTPIPIDDLWQSQDFRIGNSQFTIRALGNDLLIGDNSSMSSWSFDGSVLPAGNSEPAISSINASGKITIFEKSSLGAYSIDESYIESYSSVMMYLSVNNTGKQVSSAGASLYIYPGINPAVGNKGISVQLSNGSTYNISSPIPSYLQSVTYNLSTSAEMITVGNQTFSLSYIEPQLDGLSLTISQYSFEIQLHLYSMKFIPGYAEKFGPVTFGVV